MVVDCRYYALKSVVPPALPGARNMQQVEDSLGDSIAETWSCSFEGASGLGQALLLLSQNADRFAPLDGSPVELQQAWKLLAKTLGIDPVSPRRGEKFRLGIVAPDDLTELVLQMHRTKCLELLLPTPISGNVKKHLLAACRFLERHDNGRNWIVAVESVVN